MQANPNSIIAKNHKAIVLLIERFYRLARGLAMRISSLLAMRASMVSRLALALFASIAAIAAASAAPVGIAGSLPAAYTILAEVRVTTGPGFRIVALARKDEEARSKAGHAPARPLLVLERRGDRFVQVGQNDQVVMKADEGGQCDPFLDGGATIAVKGRYFTVENGVACGQHWTDYITFRYDDHAGFVFDNERTESWSMNPSDAPDADALIRDGPARVRRDRPGHVTAFANWRPAP